VKEKTRTKKEFQGSWGIFLILLCLGVIPAIIYYWATTEEIEIEVEEETEDTEEQDEKPEEEQETEEEEEEKQCNFVEHECPNKPGFNPMEDQEHREICQLCLLKQILEKIE